MAKRKELPPGLVRKRKTIHIDKKIRGYGRLCETTGTDKSEEAERYLARRLEEIRQATVYGVRPDRPFKIAADYYLHDKQDKRSIREDAMRLNALHPFIGELPLHRLHMGSLKGYIDDCRARGLKTASINHGLKVVRQIVNLAASEWVDEFGLTWLDRAPKIKLLPVTDARKPRPITWAEQDRFLPELPAHLQRMALFVLNTGLRDSECCGLRWDWEAKIRGLDGSTVFLLPPDAHKGGHRSGNERLVVLNRVAQSIIEDCRGMHPEYVFIFRGRRIHHMVNTGWNNAREATGMDIRAHDLRHTFGMRLRAAGVGHRDQQDLLGHSNQNITAHYTRAEIRNLLDAVALVCDRDGEKPELTLVRVAKAS